ncbi:hypothetical protein PMI41_03975 [Phyllobacterium sp. YR531]|nr:hypothetical protein PMI41_03975 [Phyllobacterium sp. YR531]
MIRLPRQPLVGCRFYSPHGLPVDRVHRLLKRCSRFDFNNENNIAASRNKIDFPEPCAITAPYDPVTFQHQGDGSKAFSRVAAAIGFMALTPVTHLLLFHRQQTLI